MESTLREHPRPAPVTIAVIFAGFGLLLAACGPTVPDGGRTGDAAAGKALAQRDCAMCHALAAGDAAPRPDTPSFADIARKWPPDYLAEAFAEGVMVGHDGVSEMPEYRYPPDQVDDLIAYLESLR